MVEMSNLKAKLIAEIRTIAGVEDKPSPVSGGTALFYKGESIAHFHSDNELDIRLTKKKIKMLGLSHPTGSTHHPNRSPNSAWIEIRFSEPADIPKVCQLLRLAVAEFA